MRTPIVAVCQIRAISVMMRTEVPVGLFGSTNWGNVFSGIQAGAVMLGVLFGLYELRQLRRQRAAASLEKLLEEWRSHLDAPTTAGVMNVPIDEGTPVERAVKLAIRILDAMDAPESAASRSLAAALASAGATVRRLNDLGAFVEGGSVAQRDFFGHAHIRVLELGHLLEPYVLLVSVCRGSRWGLRLRRLKEGALRYHYGSRIHRHLHVHVRDHLELQPVPMNAHPDVVAEFGLRRRLIPSRKEMYQDEDWVMARIAEQVAELLAARGRTWRDLEVAAMAVVLPDVVLELGSAKA
jgi:hypothetical protein